MRVNGINIGLASTAIILAVVPGTQGRWLQVPRRNDEAHRPRQYSVYETAGNTFRGYTYAGYGPRPTVSNPSISTGVAATSKNSGEESSILVPTPGVSSVQSSSGIFGTGVSSGFSVSLSTGSPDVSTEVFTSPSSLPTGSTVSFDPQSSTADTPTTATNGGVGTSNSVAVTSSTLSTSSLLLGTTISSSESRSTIRPLKCNRDNCLRQLVRISAVATEFCATYTETINIATVNLPTYVSHCAGSPSRISSACSCVLTTVATPAITSSLAGTPSSTTKTSAPSSTSSNGGIVTSLSSSTSSDEDTTTRLTSHITVTIETTVTPSRALSSGIIQSPSTSSVRYPNSTSSIDTARSVTSSSPSFSATTSSSGFSSSVVSTSSAPYQLTNSSSTAASTSPTLLTGTAPHSAGLPISSSPTPPYPANTSTNGAVIGTSPASVFAGSSSTLAPPYPSGNSSSTTGYFPSLTTRSLSTAAPYPTSNGTSTGVPSGTSGSPTWSTAHYVQSTSCTLEHGTVLPPSSTSGGQYSNTTTFNSSSASSTTFIPTYSIPTYGIPPPPPPPPPRRSRFRVHHYN